MMDKLPAFPEHTDNRKYYMQNMRKGLSGVCAGYRTITWSIARLTTTWAIIAVGVDLIRTACDPAKGITMRTQTQRNYSNRH